jgi:hypothetical protein
MCRIPQDEEDAVTHMSWLKSVRFDRTKAGPATAYILQNIHASAACTIKVMILMRLEAGENEGSVKTRLNFENERTVPLIKRFCANASKGYHDKHWNVSCESGELKEKVERKMTYPQQLDWQHREIHLRQCVPDLAFACRHCAMRFPSQMEEKTKKCTGRCRRR